MMYIGISTRKMSGLLGKSGNCASYYTLLYFSRRSATVRHKSQVHFFFFFKVASNNVKLPFLGSVT